MKITVASAILMMSIAASVSAQSLSGAGDQIVIDSVVVIGNEDTETYVILNEMALKRGSVATTEEIEYERNRIYSLGLFTRVDLFADSLWGMQCLLVSVSERWHIIPVPVVGFRDGDIKKLYYGAGILHNNFRGRNQKLFASAVFGYNPSFGFSFRDPLIDHVNRLSLDLELNYSVVRSRSLEQESLTGPYDEKYYSGIAILGKRFGLHHFVGITVGYRSVEVTSYSPGRTVSEDGKDNFPVLAAFVTHDSRDLSEYPSRGSFGTLNLQQNGLSDEGVNFGRFGWDLRTYQPLLGDLVIAGRVHGTVAFGDEIPTYGHVFFGYGERIRGHFTTVYEGENMLGGSMELRYPIFPVRNILFSAIALPPEFSVWRFGVSVAVFADAGTTWYRGEKVSLPSFVSGFGAGLRFLLPYSVVVRTEYGFDESLNGQFILDFRRTF